MRLNEHEIDSFIFDMSRCIDSKGNVDEGFLSDSVEYLDIFY